MNSLPRRIQFNALAAIGVLSQVSRFRFCASAGHENAFPQTGISRQHLRYLKKEAIQFRGEAPYR